MFALAVTFDIVPADLDAFKAAMLINAKASLSTEPGCRQFDVCMDPERPTEIFLYEIYDDEAAFEAHTKTTHYATLQSTTEGMVKDKNVRFFKEVHQ
ncbi:quinol monooxygenase YgiN [Litoreibacter halocynthiae]|uniref:Quinol monooxygenase YgiN n=1 Tax=Litoreibacter halocynthiae TaxID=1242689 RepID=A0A4V3EWL7_9RHOB|nr:putative quinol monooxygenase [Litoreibacter halocynthiae]TDT77415.1 quinol monooxygenase YgiN [Litoreibacter halocynthiae]